jgi:lysophospholipase L1-like esterase
MHRLIAAAVAAVLAGCGGGGGTSADTSQPASLPQGTVVMIGDSITYNWKAWNVLPDTAIIDKGVPGNTTAMMEARFAADVLALHPAVVVILGGTNDISIGDYDGYTVYPTHIFNMVQAAEAAGARVIVGTVPPGKEDTTHAIPAFNKAIRDGASSYGYTVADYYPALLSPDGSENLSLFNPDGIHPNQAGYAVMWPVLAGVLQ